MSTIQSLKAALDERAIAQRVGQAHDEARMGYPLRSNTVNSVQEFERTIGDYYAHHHAACVAHGARMRPFDAMARAKQILERAYRRRNLGLRNAVQDAKTGTNGGLRVILDLLADATKAESIENYMGEVFDRHVELDSWEQRVEIIRQFMAYYGAELPDDIRSSPPERFANDYKDLIGAVVENMQKVSSLFRRV